MEKNMVFFGENGLTSTSANHIANMAKEYITNIEEQINDVVFYDTKVSLIGGEETTTKHGINEITMQSIPKMIETIMDAKSLCAWIREAIKCKDKMLNKINKIGITEYIQENNIEVVNKKPDSPVMLTDEDIINELPIKERNHYYEVQTNAAVIGKFIHNGTPINNARKNLTNVIQNETKIVGSGRDAMIYKFTPTVDIEAVDNMFFKLQKMHRSYQAEFNKIAHEITEEKTKRNLELMNEYNDKLGKYNRETEELMNQMLLWKTEESNKISQLKIVIPDKLKNIYEFMNNLGKK